jgi:hypothetical protein
MAVEPFSILVGHPTCAVMGCAAWLMRPPCRFCCRRVAWEGLSSQSGRSQGTSSSETHRKIRISKYHITARLKISPINGSAGEP